MKQVKIVDVAKEAGVSISTVSQYLNGRYKHMSEKTKYKIEAVIKEMGYIPNAIARSLKTNKTNTIGVIVFSIDGYFTSRVVRGIDDYCKKNGYNVFIYNTDYDAKIEKKSIKILKTMQVDGLIIASTGKNNELLQEVDNSGIPVIQMFMTYDDLNLSAVTSDNRQGTYEATKYLLELGHKDIALLTQPYNNIHSRKERLIGYETALIESGLELDPSRVYIWNRDSNTDEIFENILNTQKRPTAIFTLHTALTIGLLRYCNANGIRIPEDVSIIAFDKLPVADLWKTPITVVCQQTYNIGEESAKLVLSRINSEEEARIEKIILPCNLEKKASCKSIEA